MSNTPNERTSVSLSREMARRLSHEAAASGRSASAVVRDALERYFAQEEPKGLPPFVGAGASGQPDTAARDEDVVRTLIEKRHPRRKR